MPSPSFLQRRLELPRAAGLAARLVADPRRGGRAWSCSSPPRWPSRSGLPGQPSPVPDRSRPQPSPGCSATSRCSDAASSEQPDPAAPGHFAQRACSAFFAARWCPYLKGGVEFLIEGRQRLRHGALPRPQSPVLRGRAWSRWCRPARRPLARVHPGRSQDSRCVPGSSGSSSRWSCWPRSRRWDSGCWESLLPGVRRLRRDRRHRAVLRHPVLHPDPRALRPRRARPGQGDLVAPPSASGSTSSRRTSSRRWSWSGR